MSTALLVIDVQNYFVGRRDTNVPEKIAWHIKESDYDHVLFVKFRNLPESNFHTILNFTDVQASPETDIHATLQPFLTDTNVFEKTTYSALKTKACADYLEVNKVTELDLCGFCHDAGVLATAFEAFDLGYNVHIIDNLCGVGSVRDDLEPAAKAIINRSLRRGKTR